METKEKIELLKNYLSNSNTLNNNEKVTILNVNDNYITYDYDHNIMAHYFMFSDIIYSEQINYVVSLNIRFHIVSIGQNIYLAIRN